MVSDSDSEATAAGGDGVAGGASCWGRRPAGRRAQGGAARREGGRAGRGGARKEGRRREQEEGEADPFIGNGRPLFPGAWAFNLEAHVKWELKWGLHWSCVLAQNS